MLVSHRKKFIFTKTAKTAGTSIESYYERFCMPKGHWTLSHNRDEHISEEGIIGYRGPNRTGLTYYNHMPASRIKELVGDEIWRSYFKFTIVRNPFCKLVSGWYHLQSRKSIIKLKEDIRNRPTLIHHIERSDILDFRNWIQNGGKIYDRDKYTIDGEECINYFIKYETLLEDLKVINSKLGLEYSEIELPNFKSGIRNKKFETRDFYDSKTENIVRNIYNWEFERFGYEMPRSSRSTVLHKARTLSYAS